MNTSSEIRILYVEDDGDYFFLVRESLDDVTFGTYQVDWAPSYMNGREEILRNEHDLYLIDFRLGAQSGLELIKEARSEGITKPVILLTGEGDRKIDIASMEAGANDFLLKTEINSNLLERAIRYTLNQYEITEKLKSSEERLQDFLETASDWIWEMDASLQFTSFSGASGSTNGTDIIGRSPMDLIPHSFDPAAVKKHQFILDNHQPFHDFEFEIRARNGAMRYQKISGKPTFNSSGRFLGYRGTGRDLTAQRNMEDQLRQSQKMEAVGQLTGGIAHDFNNILHVVHNNLELLQDMVQDEPLFRKRITRIFMAADRGAQLTQQLLAFSRRQTLSPVTVNPNELVSETFDLLERTLGEDIEIKMDLVEPVEAVLVDSGLLGNALLNLAVNARDAMPSGGVLTIRTGTTFLDNVAVTGKNETISGLYSYVSVIDTGVGIPEEILVHVFEPFFTTKEVGEGSGLGLSMVYGFVKQSGGHLSIDSTVGEGTAVELYFPAASDNDFDLELEEDGLENAIAGKGTILLVEDDASARETTAEILETLGYQVFQAGDGVVALEQLNHLQQSDVKVDLVFSDIVMPSGMDGYQLSGEVRKKYPIMKVLLASGYPDRALAAFSGSDTDHRVLRKPFGIVTLSTAVREVLDA